MEGHWSKLLKDPKLYSMQSTFWKEPSPSNLSFGPEGCTMPPRTTLKILGQKGSSLTYLLPAMPILNNAYKNMGKSFRAAGKI